MIVVLNKIDTLSSDELTKIKNSFKKKTGIDPIAISAVSGKNIKELITEVTKIIFSDEKENL